MMEVDSLYATNFTSGGYDFGIFDKVKMTLEKYKCTVCTKVLKKCHPVIRFKCSQGHVLPVTKQISVS